MSYLLFNLMLFIIYYSQIDFMNFRIGAHGRHFYVTFFVTFYQTVPALVSLLANSSREVFGAHQAIEAAAKQNNNSY